ncbi:MAG: hypothetical protein EA385_08925 [Salinarimonadaceae bacterium]|nr:MAG: hypothetical protein EA385_08925 [Salinarimonadaceae bacterium]
MTTAQEGWERFISADEAILWQGRPDPRMSWRGGENATLLIGGFAVAVIAFLTWEAWYYDDGTDPILADGDLTGLMILLVLGVALAAIGPLVMAMVRRGTWYALTNRRAVIAHRPTVFGLVVYQGLDCYPISEVEVVPSDLPGLETVNFARLSERMTFDEGWRRVTPPGARPVSSGKWPRRDRRVGFERIADAGLVAELCRKVEAASRPAS